MLCGLISCYGNTGCHGVFLNRMFLFIIFVNELIKVMKEKCNPERFLEWLNILVLLDDTVILSTIDKL